MTDKDKPDIQNSGISSEPETAIQTPIFTEDTISLLSAAPANKASANYRLTRENYQQVKLIFQSVFSLAPADRAAFLDEAWCQGNNALRRQVEILLESYDSQFSDQSATAQVREKFVKESFENETLKIVLADETAESVVEELPEAPSENALHPSHLRFALVCLLFVLVVGANVINRRA
jgi:hypothetical protein